MRRLPFVLLLLVSLATAQSGPERFAKNIDALVELDQRQPPPKHGILFTGSSIFRQWTDVDKDMAPLPVFNRAFGGSRTADVLHYMDRVALPYEPRLIVYYCGSNDINAKVTPERIAANYAEFVDRVRAKLPATRFLYVSINRAPEKRERWSEVDSANAMIRTYSARTPGLGFIDMNPALFGDDGEPRMDLYLADKLHFKKHAYVEFTRVIRPVVEKVWAEITAGSRP